MRQSTSTRLPSTEAVPTRDLLAVQARALYRDARLLSLDEPTAALDPRSETEVFAAFAALARGRTTLSLLITHRLGSVQMADRILVMKAGRLIEDGTHADLFAQVGEYTELWRLQAEQYLEVDALAEERETVSARQ